jgi:hypothetical protein
LSFIRGRVGSSRELPDEDYGKEGQQELPGIRPFGFRGLTMRGVFCPGSFEFPLALRKPILQQPRFIYFLIQLLQLFGFGSDIEQQHPVTFIPGKKVNVSMQTRQYGNAGQDYRLEAKRQQAFQANEVLCNPLPRSQLFKTVTRQIAPKVDHATVSVYQQIGRSLLFDGQGNKIVYQG